ncbi:MAG: hypothetical protein AAGA27_07280 [Pseudomonadota bacterium]
MKKILMTTLLTSMLSLTICHLAFGDNSDRNWSCVTGATDQTGSGHPYVEKPTALIFNANGNCESNDQNCCIPQLDVAVEVSNEQYARCFRMVIPNPNKNPTKLEEKLNKDIIVRCLKDHYPMLNNVNPSTVDCWVNNAMDAAREDQADCGGNPPPPSY